MFCEWLDKQWDTSYLPGKIHDQIQDGFEEEHDTSIIGDVHTEVETVHVNDVTLSDNRACFLRP